MKLRTHTWNELRSPEIEMAREAGAIVLVPVGSTEQHGSHLPLNTDILSATRVALGAAELSENPPVLVANVVSVGFSPHHMMRPGAISLRLETFTAIVHDVVRSLQRHGFRKIIFVNGHGGNTAPLSAVAHQLATDGMPMVFCSYFDLIREEIGESLEGSRKTVGHAGEFETSLLLHLRPNSVDFDAAIDVSSPPWNPELPRDPIMDAGGTFPPIFAPNSTGVLGDARKGNAKMGEKLFEVAVRRLGDLVRAVAETDLFDESVWDHARSTERRDSV